MRTCLLCEKPLSRIWLGAGEDFCSREHRNQYRLRRGMDRLLEANKVASLMRRRENPKPLAPLREMGETGIPRRGFFEPQFARPAEAPLLPEILNRAGTARRSLVLVGETHFADGPVDRRPKPLPARHEAEAPRLALGQTAPEIPARRVRQAVHIVAAGPAHASARTPGGVENGTRQLRHAGILWYSAERLHLDPQRHVTPAVFHAFHEPHGHRPATVSGPRGYSLRVSLGAGFRIQATRLRGLKVDLPQPQVPESRREMQLHSHSPSGRPVPQPASGPALLLAVPGIPALEWEDPEARMEWPGLLSPWGCPPGCPQGPVPHQGPELAVRSHGEVWTGFRAAFPPPIRHGGRDQARPRMRILGPVGLPPAVRAATVPIGCVADGVDSRPGAPPESRSSVEERFDAGWKNWTGGFANWTVDAAGARTGALALFTPSMEWRDYEIEFFTRIENRSVTWVYRAAGLNDYYMAALTALPGKGYAFTRRTVWRGKAGAASTAPLSVLPNPKSAYLIRMRIAGNQFSLSIDGQLVETWTDTRLSSGGVGFMGAPEDRARIYWVRFYPGPAKEFSRT
ncbi:MAG: hypothetical protein ACLQU1_18000 [Bryobacteraceae bacterium]